MGLFDIFKSKKQQQLKVDVAEKIEEPPKIVVENKIEEPFIRIKDDYVEKGINYYYTISGMEYQNLGSYLVEEFTGYVQIEDNLHDPYAIAVYKSKTKKLGYIPKGSKQLYDSLKSLHNGTAFCFGYIDYGESWNRSFVNVVTGLDENELSLIKESFTIQKKLDKLSNNAVYKVLSIDERFKILETTHLSNEKLKKISQDYDYNFNLQFPALFIPGLAKELEQAKDWSNLLKLERYLSIINNLNDRFKYSILKKIALAKEKLQ
jgi:hypothetical protein